MTPFEITTLCTSIAALLIAVFALGVSLGFRGKPINLPLPWKKTEVAQPPAKSPEVRRVRV